MNDYVTMSGNISITNPAEAQKAIDNYFNSNLKRMFVVDGYRITAEWYGEYDDDICFAITCFLEDIAEITLNGNIMLESDSGLSGFYFDGDCWPEYNAITITPEDVGGMAEFVRIARNVRKRSNVVVFP